MIINKAKEADIPAVVKVHLSAFSGFFLTDLGKGFLTEMYRGYVYHESSCLLTAIDNEERIIGFVSYTLDLSDLYSFMLKKRGLFFACHAFIAFIKKPSILMRLSRAFSMPRGSKKVERYAKLTSIGVLPEYKQQGVGGALLRAVIEDISMNNVSYLSLETDADQNEKVNNFYQKSGLKLYTSYLTPEGRKMNEYRYIPEPLKDS